MQGLKCFFIILFSNIFLLAADEAELQVHLKNLTTLNKTHFKNSLSHLHDYIIDNKVPREKRVILTSVYRVCTLLEMNKKEQVKASTTLGRDLDIYRKCFTCKGTRVIKNKNRCKTCKAKGKCVRCKGSGKISKKIRDFTIYENCTCFNGRCPECKGNKYLDAPCDSCHLGAGVIDIVKTKKYLAELYHSYLTIAEAVTERKEEPLKRVVVNDKPQKLRNDLNIPIWKIKNLRNSYNGFLYQDDKGLNVIFRAESICDPTKFKCEYNGQQFKIKDISFSQKYSCFKMLLEQKTNEMKPVPVAQFNRSQNYMLYTGERSDLYSVNSMKPLSSQLQDKGVFLLQGNKICGVIEKEKLVIRTSLKSWFVHYSPYKIRSGMYPFGSDFLETFTALNRDDLELDLLYLSQYIEFENRLLAQVVEKKVTVLPLDDLAYLNSLKSSFTKNKWKTDWANITSQKIVKMIDKFVTFTKQ